MFEIPLCEPQIAGNEWTYVKDCLDTGWVSSVGSYVAGFEQRLTASTGARHAVAVTSGTAALHLALLTAGVGNGDEVLVSDLTFIAPVNAVTYVGAQPVLVDADAKTWQMDLDALEAFLESCSRANGALTNPRSGRRVAALLPVHILGSGVEMGRLCALADRFSLPVIEDATEALGARCGARALGTWGRIGCLSFNGNKTITTGGGGALLTDDDEIARRARYLSTQAKDDPREMRHDAVGFNYRLSNVLAAIGCAQLERLSSILARKRQVERTYRDALQSLAGLSFPSLADDITPSSWLTTVRLDASLVRTRSRALIDVLHAKRIEARPLWTPIHRNAPFAHAERVGGETAAMLHAECVSLPSSAGISDVDLNRVIDALLCELA